VNSSVSSAVNVRNFAIAAAVLALVLLPYVIREPYYVGIASQILLYAVFALGLNILVGYGGLVSLGHAGLSGATAYAVAYLLAAGHGHLVAIGGGLAAGLIVSAGFAALALRATGISFIMITLALGEIVWGLAYRWISITGGDNGLSVSARPAPFGLSLNSAAAFYNATLVVFLLAIAACAIFVHSPLGAALAGTRDQPRRMNALGFHVWMIRFWAFMFSGLLSAVSGILFIYFYQFVSPPALALTSSAEALLMVISGGAGTLLGPVIGAALVIIIKLVVSAYISRWNFMLGAIFVAIVVFMPEGLVPGTVRLMRAAWRAVNRDKAAAAPPPPSGRSGESQSVEPAKAMAPVAGQKR
jgi:branched-chain amino acid transport system permease protein